MRESLYARNGISVVSRARNSAERNSKSFINNVDAFCASGSARRSRAQEKEWRKERKKGKASDYSDLPILFIVRFDSCEAPGKSTVRFAKSRRILTNRPFFSSSARDSITGNSCSFTRGRGRSLSLGLQQENSCIFH